MGRTACKEPQCLYNGALYFYLYLYYPYGPYSFLHAVSSVEGFELYLEVKCTVVLALRLCIGRTVDRGIRGIGNGIVHPSTGTEALCRLYGP